jgi:hypothetical protein
MIEVEETPSRRLHRRWIQSVKPVRTGVYNQMRPFMPPGMVPHTWILSKPIKEK